MNRLTLTRRAALTSLALMPLLAACGSNDTTPHVDPSASSYGTLRIGYGALREMRAVAHVYARALRQVGYSVELVDTDNSRATALRGLMVPSANSATPTATLPDDEESSAATVEALDLVIDYSGDLLLYLTDDGKISPAAAQNERIRSGSRRDPAPGRYPPRGGEHRLRACYGRNREPHRKLHPLRRPHQPARHEHHRHDQRHLAHPARRAHAPQRCKRHQ